MFYWHKRYASAIADLKKKKKPHIPGGVPHLHTTLGVPPAHTSLLTYTYVPYTYVHSIRHPLESPPGANC